MKMIFKKIWSIVSKVLIGLLIILMIITLVMKIMGKNPTIFGLSLYYIATPSMEPTLEVGDIIMSKKVNDYQDLEIDDVITYNGLEGSYKGKLITHQIIDIIEEDGEYTFITQGTKEGAKIDPAVSQEQVVSVMLFEVPLLGKTVQLLSNKIVFFVVIIIPLAVMLVFEVFKLFKVFKEEDVIDEEKN